MSEVGLNEYQSFTASSTRVPLDGVDGAGFVCLGLFGEIGSLLSVFKKNRRDVGAFSTYREELVEELGDALWYLANLSYRLGLPLEEIGRAVLLANNQNVRPTQFYELQTNSLAKYDAAVLESTLLVLAHRQERYLSAWRGSRKLRGVSNFAC